MPAFMAPHVEDSDDIGVRQLGDNVCFLEEARAEQLILGQPAGQHLERDGTIERFLCREIDHSHAAMTEFALDPVARDTQMCQVGWCYAHVGPGIA